MRNRDLQLKILKKQIEFEKLGSQYFTTPTTNNNGVLIIGGRFKKKLNSKNLEEQLKNYSLIEINKNIELLNEDGCIEIKNSYNNISIIKITNKGYDFLDENKVNENYDIKNLQINNSTKKLTETLRNSKVFVTYSWDSQEHEEWVMNLVNTLRIEDGIDATLDKYEIQKGTINLNRMMIDNIYNYDYVVVILTENYAKRANEELGGVGFESTSLMDILKNSHERNKIIPLNRHNGDFNSTIPHFLRGYNLTDISDKNFKDGYEDLVRKIKGINKYEIPELGKGREQTSKKAKFFNLGDIEIPDLKPITNNDKESFIKKNFDKMLEIFEETFSVIQNQNPNFLYSIEDMRDYVNVSISLEGVEVKTMNFWIGNFGNFNDKKDSIFYQYTENTQNFYGMNKFNKNQYNGMFSINVSQDGKLSLKNHFGFLNGGNTIKEITENLIRDEFIKSLTEYHSRNLINRY